MNKMIAGLLLVCAAGVWGKEFDVSSGGELKKALQRVSDGDTLWLAAGRYEEPIVLNGVDDVRIVAEEGAEVLMDGSRALPQNWTKWKDGIWKQAIDFDVWQLFSDDRLVYVARWPDASFEDNTMWRMMQSMRSSDGGYNKRRDEWIGDTRFGLIVDDSFHRPKTVGFREGDTRYAQSEEFGFDRQPGSLADTGKDFTGAIAVLNIGHWLTWARPVLQHEAGSDRFTYAIDGIRKYDVHQFSGYYMLGLAALDRPNEWWFDSKTKTVYYMPSDGMNPNQMALRGKVRDFGLALNGCSDIRISGLHFLGQGFEIRESSRVTVEHCDFTYPATHKFMLGDFSWYSSSNSRKSGNKMPSLSGGEQNRFLNCRFTYCNAPLYFGGEKTLVENCLFSDIEWDLNSNGGSGSVLIGDGGVFRRNTVTRCGNSEGVRAAGPGSVIELNHLYDMSNLQHDGSGLNIGMQHHYKTLVKQNWVHDSNRQGVRFDYAGTGVVRKDGELHGDGVYMRNVTWNTEPNEVKGDRHLVLNNTVVNVNRFPDSKKEEVTMTLQGFKALHEIEGNNNSLGRNNLALLLHRSFNMEKNAERWSTRKDGYRVPPAMVLPGTTDHNIRERGGAYTHLRDPANYDFRPKDDSPAVNGGAPVADEELPSPVSNFPGLDYEGSAPDVGAYEFNAKRYWIPGRQEPVATTPIPRDGAVNVKLDADLMFLEAYQAEHHRVYVGTAPDALKSVAEFQTLETNIVDLPRFGKNKTYYWQVGAVDADGEEHRSGVWKFTTGK